MSIMVFIVISIIFGSLVSAGISANDYVAEMKWGVRRKNED